HSVVEFSHLSEKKSVTTEELAAVIERDSALVVEVLRYVNSAIVGLRWKVQSVARAMAAIGIRRTRTLLLTAALQQVLKGATSKFIHPLRFQRDNAERSLFAGETARLIGGDPETARTACLLQDLLLPMLTDAYTDTYRKFDPKASGLVEFERKHFGWDHAALLAKLMSDWGFPDELVACVGLHHSAERVLADQELARTSVGAAAVASLLPDAMQQSFNGIERLLTLQDNYPEFVWMEVAARVDTVAGEAGDIYGGRTELCGRLEKMALARLRRARLEAVLVDQQVGNYAIEEKLGEGGMGVVYRARHRLLKRPAAVKLLQSTSFDRAAVQRFESEVQLTCQLTSPNTVAVYDYGVTPQGLLFYAMEYIEGLTLNTLVNRFGPVTDGRCIHLLTQACRSLQEAHDCGLIHRDIKPDNIMLTRRGGVCDVVKVLDFGLACTMDGKHQGVCGTPAFLAPEAIMSPETADARRDLYALGAVGYYLLSGSHLFDARETPDVLRHQVRTVPPPLAKRCERTVDPALEALIMACLAKDPGLRPPSAQKFAELLSRCPSASEWSDKHATEWWDSVGPSSGADGALKSTRSQSANEEFTTAPTRVGMTEVTNQKFAEVT
ncbi:MAG: HDOD domain-containing protein, partial [Planctomycetaceae bacterium]|nr:HDOD domain-containing protein [Planctomycetaceae bacterium]